LRSEDILDLLSHLLEKSMVVGEQSADGAARYRLLETLRQYGLEQMTQGPEAAIAALRTRHATYFVAFGEQLAVGVRGPDQLKWADRFEIELDNIRAGLEWGKAADAPPDRVELLLRLAAALYIPSLRRGYSREARQHLESLLAQRSAQRPTRTRARALFAVGSLAMWQDRDDVTAWALLNESFSLAEQLSDTRVMADARRNLGAVLYNRGDKAAARRHHEQALQLSQADGDVYGIRWSLEDLGDMAADEGNTTRAEKLFEKALSLARQIGDLFGIASILQCMGNLARATGKAELAGELIKEALTIFMKTAMGRGARIAWCLRDLAFVASAAAADRAVRLLSAADALQEKSGIMTPTISVEPVEQILREARLRLGEAAYVAAWSEGRAMSLSQATAYALGPAAAAD
jgi:non-specific serine/threonine protein kinase